MENILTMVFTSSLVAGSICTILSHYFTLKVVNTNYKNEYYKILIKKRIEAYEYIETQTAIFRMVVFDDIDRRYYHLMFSKGEESFIEFQRNLVFANKCNLWLDDNINKTLDEINNLFYNIVTKLHNKSEEEAINIGKEYYQQISDFRIKLENDLRKALRDLYKIKPLLLEKEKKEKRFFSIE